jgi:preprotein translocase subunit SecD/SecD/SecF fusion protein
VLNFSKINVLIIYLLFGVIALFSFLNFQDDNKKFVNKKINLGLDLQGGSLSFIGNQFRQFSKRKNTV